jgi:alpha-1,2-mannosyltransferase
MFMFTATSLVSDVVIVSCFFLGFLYLNLRRRRHGRVRRIAFFHPYCSGGGGGERVLWKMIQVLHQLRPDLALVVYTIDPPHEHYKETLTKHVSDLFSLHLPPTVSFVHLHEYAHLLRPARRFSLVVESWNTMKLAHFALRMQQQHEQQAADIFVDTMGAAFTFLAATAWHGLKSVAYVHYPTISTDMLRVVVSDNNDNTGNNKTQQTTITTFVQTLVAKLRAAVKVLYYILFAICYGLVCGSLPSLVLVNSTWTRHHVDSLWMVAARMKRIHTVFPPCHVEVMHSTTKPVVLTREARTIVSIGQFRPEKNHALQLRATHTLLELEPTWKSTLKLVLIGGVRNDQDQARLDKLQELSRELGIEQNVEFVMNQPMAVLQDWMQRGTIGIHTVRTLLNVNVASLYHYVARALESTYSYSPCVHSRQLDRCGMNTLE